MRRKSGRPKPAGTREEAVSKDEPRVNRRIRVPRVLVIDGDGRKLGEFLTEDAIALANERGLDLVEVSPNARPPVCRIVDYGRFKYKKKKLQAETKRNQLITQIKEVKLRPKTDQHDMDTKVKLSTKFLEQGHKVKITVRFRGREMAHREIGQEQCLRIAEAIGSLAAIETPPKMEGRQMFMVIAPTRKPTRKPTPRKTRTSADSGSEE